MSQVPVLLSDDTLVKAATVTFQPCAPSRISMARAVELEVLGERYYAVVARTFADARTGDGTTLITGSFHTVGDAMARLQVSPLAA